MVRDRLTAMKVHRRANPQNFTCHYLQYGFGKAVTLFTLFLRIKLLQEGVLKHLYTCNMGLNNRFFHTVCKYYQYVFLITLLKANICKYHSIVHLSPMSRYTERTC